MSAYPEPPAALDAGLVMRVVRARAGGRSWADVAAELCWAEHDLCRACDLEPTFPAALARATKEAEDEGNAVALRKLREYLNDANPEIARDAATRLAECLADRNAARVKLEVEQLKAQTRLAVEKLKAEARLEVEKLKARTRLEAERLRAARRGAPAGGADDEGEDDDAAARAAWAAASRAGQAAQRPVARHYAEQIVREGAEVYLWGGCHPLGGAVPDATDTPLRLMARPEKVRRRTLVPAAHFARYRHTRRTARTAAQAATAVTSNRSGSHEPTPTHGPYGHASRATARPAAVRSTKSTRSDGRAAISRASAQNPGTTSGTNHRTDRHPPPQLSESSAYTPHTATHHSSSAPSSIRSGPGRATASHPHATASTSAGLYTRNPCGERSRS